MFLIYNKFKHRFYALRSGKLSKTVPGTMIADHYNLTFSEAKFSHLRRRKKRLRYLRYDKTNHVYILHQNSFVNKTFTNT